jgi:ElaB/YqjD/DUF883 family membrane-anchored ribosome-binding protein
MDTNTKTIKDSVDALTEDARALFAATSDATEEKIIAARKRLAAALDNGQTACSHIGETAIESAKTVERMARSHFRATVGLAFGVGALCGGLLVHHR